MLLLSISLTTEWSSMHRRFKFRPTYMPFIKWTSLSLSEQDSNLNAEDLRDVSIAHKNEHITSKYLHTFCILTAFTFLHVTLKLQDRIFLTHRRGSVATMPCVWPRSSRILHQHARRPFPTAPPCRLSRSKQLHSFIRRSQKEKKKTLCNAGVRACFPSHGFDFAEEESIRTTTPAKSEVRMHIPTCPFSALATIILLLLAVAPSCFAALRFCRFSYFCATTASGELLIK